MRYAMRTAFTAALLCGAMAIPASAAGLGGAVGGAAGGAVGGAAGGAMGTTSGATSIGPTGRNAWSWAMPAAA